MRSETPAHSRCGGCPAKVGAGGGVGPLQAACRTVDDAEERPDRQLESELEPGLELVPAPRVHSGLAPAPALAAPDQERAAALIEVAFGECERLLMRSPARQRITIKPRSRRRAGGRRRRA